MPTQIRSQPKIRAACRAGSSEIQPRTPLLPWRDAYTRGIRILHLAWRITRYVAAIGPFSLLAITPRRAVLSSEVQSRVRVGKDIDKPVLPDTEVKRGQADLPARIAANDRSAEAELVKHYSKAIRFFLQRRYHDPMFVEDVCQETFCRVIVQLRKGKVVDVKALPAYVRNTAINVGREYVRQSERFQSETTEDQLVELPSYEPGPLELANTRDLQKLVRDLVQELSVERDQIILIRFHFDKIDKSIICRELGLEPIHFDRVLHRARQRLKQKMEFKYGLNNPAIVATVFAVFGGLI